MNDDTALTQTEQLPQEQAASPPYVSFSTFKTLLDWLRTEGVPLRLDRSFWKSKFSGSTGTQVVAALRFLGLMEGDRPLPDLESLVEASPDERRFILKELLRDSYKAVPYDDLPRATPAMVMAWFRSYPVAGHTLRKAISFFVNAAKEAETPMSGSVRRMAKTKTQRHGAGELRGNRRDRHSAPPPPTSPNLGKPPSPTIPTAAGDMRSPEPNRTRIALESGGVVTLDLAVDLFHLSERDREFVLKLVDLTRSYAREQADLPGGSASDADEAAS